MSAENQNQNPPAKSIPEWDAWMAEHPDVEIVAPDGTVFKVAPPERWPDDAVELLQDEKPVGAVRAVLAEQYEAWTSTGANCSYFLDRVGVVAGLDVGESSASSS